MNDLANLFAKFLPVAVITGLLAIFYLLDVFSVRPSLDSAPTKRVSVAQPALPSGAPASSPPATRRIDFPVAPTGAAVSGVAVPPADAQSENEIDADDPPLLRQGEVRSERIAPRYLAPGGNAEQPLATDLSNGQGPVQLPSHEITQDEAERIEAETQRGMNELDNAAAAAGRTEQQE